MENRFNRLATKQRFSEISIKNSYLTETLPDDAPSGADPVINIKQMITGRVNFKIIYNLVKKFTLNKCRTHTSTTARGYTMFLYDSTVKGVISITPNASQPLYTNCINGINNATNQTLLNSCVTASSTGLPVLTSQYGHGVTYGYEYDGTLYYFIPAYSTTSTSAYIGLGVLSTCWNHPTSNVNPKWIVGRRLSINKSYNYIIEIKPNGYNYGYTYTYYRYTNTGSYSTASTQTMNENTFDVYNDTTHNPNGKATVNTYSVNNRLSGNFYDILNGFKHYGCDVDNRLCAGFYCQQRDSSGTGNETGFYNLHVAPLQSFGTSNQSLNSYTGSNRLFDLYRNVTFVDLSRFTQNIGTLSNFSLMIYAGDVVYNSGSTNPTVKITESILDLNSKFGTTTTGLNRANTFNNYIKLTARPDVSSGGRNLYVILAPSTTIPVYCNYMKNYTTNIWGTGAAAIPSEMGLTLLTNLTSSYYCIIETWTESAVNGIVPVYAKVYKYNTSSGICQSCSNTIKVAQEPIA